MFLTSIEANHTPESPPQIGRRDYSRTAAAGGLLCPGPVRISNIMTRSTTLAKFLWLAQLIVWIFVSSPAIAQISKLFAPEPKGSLVIVGGGDTPTSVLDRFIGLAGGAEKARVAVFPMASLKSDEEAQEVLVDLQKLGAEAHVVSIGQDDANSESTAKYLEQFSGYWFSGGDQSHLADLLVGTKALETIERRYREGAVIGGTSAGASVMTTLMLTGRFRKAKNPGEEETLNIARGMKEVVSGFGIFKGAIVDQHFMHRARYNRLLSAVLDHPELIGVGIDEETALLVRPDGVWEVLGNHYVKIFDARKARIIEDDRPMAKAADMRMHVLPEGSTFNPKRRKVTFPSD